VPPLVAAVIAAVVSWRNAAPLAYAGGSLGVLIGADLLNLGKLQGLGAPVASIGGAGTFDGAIGASLSLCRDLTICFQSLGQLEEIYPQAHELFTSGAVLSFNP
jgi:Protein of unknown function (DUF1614)